MLATALIVFREVLEAALIVSIVLAASKTIPGRSPWIAGGVAVGIGGALLVAAFASVISDAAAGMGQELFNAIVLALAVIMLGWHSVWMSRHSREMAKDLGAVAHAVSTGNRPLYALALVVGAAVLREGSETVLFLKGIAAGEDNPEFALIAGGMTGITGGVAAGAALYLGLLRIPVRYLFSVTNWMVLLLAAGMASQATGFLVQAGLVPDLGSAMWDTSWLLSEKSLVGKVLHALTGYVARPAGIQVLAFIATLIAIAGLTTIFAAKPVVDWRRAAMFAAGLVLLGSSAYIGRAHAGDFKIISPNIDYREIEIEMNTATTFDKRPENKNRGALTKEVGVGVLPFWFVEFEAELGREPGEKWQYNASTIENIFMLTEPGKYWMDFGIFAEYSRAKNRTEADSVKVGGLFLKEHDKFVHTLNVFLEKEVGPNAGTADTLSYAWQTRYRFSPLFQPGIELYGEIGDLNAAGKFNDRQFRIGPVVAGNYNLGEIGGRGKIKYEVGYLFGATTPTEQGTFRTRLELEIPF